MPYDIEYKQAEKPSWLKDDDRVYWNNLTHKAKDVPWGRVKTFTLDVEHPYYRATAKGFKYWPGGDAAPDDWDCGEVLFTNGACHEHSDRSHKWTWSWSNYVSDIIGYHPKPEVAAVPSYQLQEVERYLTESIKSLRKEIEAHQTILRAIGLHKIKETP